MKVELFKDTNFLGEVSYFILVDDKYVTGSTTYKEDKALEMYDFIINNKSLKKNEVIKQTEI